VLKLYGGRGEAKKVCPSEAKCDDFQGAAGMTRKQKERNACAKCPMLETKTDEGRKSHMSLESLAKRSLDIRYERLTGYPRKEHLMTNFECSGMFIAEQIFESEEIALKENTLTMLCALAGVKRNG
jgi:hypothetical protein